MDKSDLKILVIGLGEIGYSNSEYMTKKGLHVDGFDINPDAVFRAIKDGVIKKEASSFSNYDFYVICVSTHKPENMSIPYLDGVFEIVEKISKEGKSGSLLGIDSTIPRGTSQEIANLLNHKLHVVHVPHRYYKFEKEKHGVNQTRVIGSYDDCCFELAEKIYGKILGIPLHKVSNIDIAEMTKIAENSYRYVQIAFAEELKMLCDNIGINFDELRDAINTKWNVDILEAQKGIGGHCLPKDSQMILNLEQGGIKNSIIESSKKIDSQYRMHIKKKKSLTILTEIS